MSGPLRLYNTLTRSKEVFEPIDRKNVRLYVCGPTVYDYAHIGNARPVIVFDVLFRLLRHLYGEDHVVYARNITDVDDKINARAAQDFPGLPLNEAIAKVTEATEKQFRDDVAALGCLPPTYEPRATEHIEEMKALIERLVARGLAYVAEDNVLFSPAAMDRQPGAPRYGSLARRSLDEMLAGARVDVAPYKRDPMDFVLWKPSKPGEPGWPSPCGIAPLGRPGWHIECSAMSMAKLLAPFGGGLTCDDPEKNIFDIHGGGIDLVFPHHENEIAQSCCAFGTPRMANYWMHNGFLQVEGEKMSKSLGNFVTINELLNGWHGEVVRLQMLMTHYRQPIDWVAKKSSEVEDELSEWATVLAGTEAENDGYRRAVQKERLRPSRGVVEALLDDLNTSEALAAVRANYKAARDGGDGEKKQFLMDCEFLGVLRHNKLWVHMQGLSSRDTVGLPDAYEDVRKLKISIANSLPGLQQKAEQRLAELGLGAEIAEGGHVTLIPMTEAAKDAENKIENMILARNEARRAKNFKESDRIRDELLAMGVALKDNKDGTTIWEVKR